MSGRFLALMAVMSLSITPRDGQARTATKPWNQPKTPWGDPDLQGVWPGTSMFQTPLERDLKLGTRAILNDEEFAQRITQATAYKNNLEGDSAPARAPRGAGWADYGKPNRQASLVVDPPDGRIPPLTPEAQKREANRLARRRQIWDSPDTWEDLATWDRCITLGVVGGVLPLFYNSGNQILQAPGIVVFRNEMIHEARVIPLDGTPHAGPHIRQYMGDSVGHWEGNSLVVETTNFNGRVAIENNGTLPTEALRTVERFTRVDRDTLNYQITIDDPKTWTKPWTIAFPLRHDPDYQQINEYACHEGNISMYDSLSGARAREAATKVHRLYFLSFLFFSIMVVLKIGMSKIIQTGTLRTKLPFVVTVLAAVVTLVAGLPAWAHHSFPAEFDTRKPVKLAGTVTQMDWINPHAWIHLAVKGGDGKVTSWMVETGSPNVLLRRGFTKKSLEAGTVIIVQGYLAKNGENKVNGGILTFKDGKKLFVGGSNPDVPYTEE